MTVNTVLGPVAADELGHVQPHEHLLADLRRYAPVDARDEEITLLNCYRSRVDRDNRRDFVLDDVDLAVTELAAFRAAGGGTVVDATPGGLGRNPLGLRKIAERSGTHIVMGSGYYVAAFHPPEVATLSREEITERIVADVTVGVDGVRAGIIGEIGLSWPPHPDEVKVLDAAAAAQARSGAALLIHPGRHVDAPMHHLERVIAAGGDPARTIMSHVDRTLFTSESMVALAATGCVLEFDLFGTESSYYPQDPSVDLPNDGVRVRWIAALIEAGFERQLLISSDICRRTQLTRYGGEGYGHILRRVLPLMRARGISAAEIDVITRDTPRSLLTLGGAT
jgi:phosphotriesterase-related protein